MTYWFFKCQYSGNPANIRARAFDFRAGTYFICFVLFLLVSSSLSVYGYCVWSYIPNSDIVLKLLLSPCPTWLPPPPPPPPKKEEVVLIVCLWFYSLFINDTLELISSSSSLSHRRYLDFFPSNLNGSRAHIFEKSANYFDSLMPRGVSKPSSPRLNWSSFFLIQPSGLIHGIT